MRTRLRKRTAVLAVAALGAFGAAGAGFGAPAFGGGANPHTLEVEKVVVGTPPPGTTFTININCTTTGDVPFNFNGSGVQEVLLSTPGNTCTVSEPGTGGAVNVSFACQDDQGASECTSPNSINLSEPGTSRFTVVNEFAPSTPETPLTPATPVPGTPRFTG